MRPTPHLERRLARFESLPRSIELGGPACEGWRGAAQQKGAAAGLLTRKAHPWVDSRPSEDQAAFAGRGRSDEGLALWLPSLSDPASVAHPPPSIALARHPTWPRHRWRTSYPRAGHRPPRPRTEPQVRRPLKPMSSDERRRSARRRSSRRERGDTAPRTRDSRHIARLSRPSRRPPCSPNTRRKTATWPWLRRPQYASNSGACAVSGGEVRA